MVAPNSIMLCALFDASDWIAIAGVMVNSLLAVWIVTKIQNTVNNKRILKDHFIAEIKNISEEYRIFLNDLQLGKVYPKTVIPWFKMMSIKTSDLLRAFEARYAIDKDVLSPYRDELNSLITESEDYANNYRDNNVIILSEITKHNLIKFHQQNNKLFTEVIIRMNDAK